MAKKKENAPVTEEIKEDISISPLEDVMGDKYAIYAKYVIQDRAIPDVRDGLKPVQRRIIYSMWEDGNTFNKPTKKCAHTVGAVMGTYHPHGDSSIYEALSRMSQDWKVRYPLIDFQGNNGSIDGDGPAAYRYTESRLSKLSNELIRDIDKETVDMQLNYDDTRLEPIVLPSRFPNLLVNGSEGIAVGLATEIPPHNLGEVIEATIYRIKHKECSFDEILSIIKGPDFPTGGIIYNSDGLRSIYTTGRGRIEIAAKTEIVELKDMQQIIISEVPYKVVKINIAYEIDKIRVSKSIDGIIEVRDESDISGIKIVVDIKKDAKADLILAYLMNKTSLRVSYSANMVAIVDGRPKTLNILDYLDAYIAHQKDVVTRKTKYDLEKFTARLHIVNGLIIASLNINEVVEIIKKSKDKADSKVNLMKAYALSSTQAEAIVTMPLYKLSHTDEIALENEKKELEKNINKCHELLSDEVKLEKEIISDLREISKAYGDERRTAIEEKGETVAIDKRELIAKEEQMVSLTRDGYAKRSTLKSYKASGDNPLPGIKEGDVLVGISSAFTTDYLVSFTSRGNYVCIPIHYLSENKWKDEGSHLNQFFTFSQGEKIIDGLVINQKRDDLYLVSLSRNGQIKRMNIDQLDYAKHSRPTRFMKISPSDEVVSVTLTSGNSDLLVLTENGKASMFNENELTILSSKAGGVKAMNGLAKDSAVSLLSYEEGEKSKIILISDKGCVRVTENTRISKTSRLGKVQEIFTCFKNDNHKLIKAVNVNGKEPVELYLKLSDTRVVSYLVTDFRLTEDSKNMKKNVPGITLKDRVAYAYGLTLNTVNDTNVARDIIVKEKPVKVNSGEELDNLEEEDETLEPHLETSEEVKEPTPVESKPQVKGSGDKEKEESPFVQMSIFDDFDDE
ncbi:MAG: DNA topoisomerase IV subunit A [Coprobacillus sp.]|nr:DNA topoisomerase IV subunit A [Coprobacillus sp.]